MFFIPFFNIIATRSKKYKQFSYKHHNQSYEKILTSIFSLIFNKIKIRLNTRLAIKARIPVTLKIYLISFIVYVFISNIVLLSRLLFFCLNYRKIIKNTYMISPNRQSANFVITCNYLIIKSSRSVSISNRKMRSNNISRRVMMIIRRKISKKKGYFILLIFIFFILLYN